MKYLLLIYENEAAFASLPEAEQGKVFGEYMDYTAAHQQERELHRRARRCSRPRPPRPCASRTARRSPRTAPSRRRASSSAGTTWWRRRTSTRPSPRGRHPRRAHGAIEVRPIMPTPPLRVAARLARADAPSGRLDCRARAMDFESVYREQRPRALATLIRLLRDFDLAEDTLQEAFAAALQQWPVEGAPRNPCAWLVSAARHKAIDRLRRAEELRGQAWPDRVAGEAALPPPDHDGRALPRRPAAPHLHLLPSGARARGPGGAHAQDAVRPLGRGDRARVPGGAGHDGAAAGAGEGQDPRGAHPLRGARRRRLAERLDGVLRVVYLVFNEGYAATAGDALVRRELCARGHPPGPAAARAAARRRRGRRPAGADAAARLAARRRASTRRASSCPSRSRTARSGTARRSPRGWPWSRRRCARGGAGFYALQAAIAALHAQAARAADTDWPQIARALRACCCACIPRRWWRSTTRRRWRWARAGARPAPHGALEETGELGATTCCPRPGPISCGAWAAARKRPPRTSARSRS